MSNSFDWLNPEYRRKVLEQIELITRQTKPFHFPFTKEKLLEFQQILQQFQPKPEVPAYISSLHRELTTMNVPVISLAPAAPQTANPAPKSKVSRWKASIGTHAAARRMETYIETKGLDFKKFAKRAGTTDRTLRKFRRTGLVRRSVFDEIAKAMGLTRDGLLKS
jgi:hypothetical protein